MQSKDNLDDMISRTIEYAILATHWHPNVSVRDAEVTFTSTAAIITTTLTVGRRLAVITIFVPLTLAINDCTKYQCRYIKSSIKYELLSRLNSLLKKKDG